MARELSPTLEAQQKWGLITWPYLIAKISNKWGGVIRYSFEQVYSTSEGELSENILLRPSANGSHIGIPYCYPEVYEHFACVDGGFGGIDQTYVYTDNNQPGYDLFALPNPTPNPAGIYKVVLTVRARDVEAITHDEFSAKMTGWDGGVETLTNELKNYSYEFINNPSTGLAWTWAQINSLEVGLFFRSQTGYQERCTQVWIDIYVRQSIEYLHAASQPSDGSLIRLKVVADNGNNKLYYDRVTNPTPESDFTTWDDLGIANVIQVASCCLGARVAQFYVNSALQLYWRQSTTNGASWGEWALIGTLNNSPNIQLAATYFNTSQIRVYYTKNNWIYYNTYDGASWGSWYGNTRTIYYPTGLAACYLDDFRLVETGQSFDGDNLLLPIGPGELTPIILRESTEPFTFAAPSLAITDTIRLFFVENFTQEEQTHRVWYSYTPLGSDWAASPWLEPQPMNIETHYGLDITQVGSYAWLSNGNKVYRALTTANELDITSRILEVDMRIYPDIRKGSLKLVLDNTGGWYNSLKRIGDEITIGIGYHTSAGAEYSLGPSFWITKQKLVAPPWYPLRMIYPVGIIGTLVLETEDAWRILYRYRTRRHLSWGAGTNSVKELLQFFLARAGLSVDVISESSAIQNFKPAFEVKAGTSYRTAIKNLLKMVPDQLVFREAKVYLRNPTTDEPVDWTYHNLIGTNLLVFRGKYGESAWDPNRAEVWGDTFMKTVANYPQIQKVRDRLSRVTTPTYPSLARATERADAELRRAEILTGEDSWMNAPTNCGLEPWDKLQITDINAGVSNIIRRVIRIKTYWNLRHWAYQQIMTLGAD